MTLLDHIEARVGAGYPATLDKNVWRKSGLRIAGHTHLDLMEQPVSWAKSRGIEVIDENNGEWMFVPAAKAR